MNAQPIYRVQINGQWLTGYWGVPLDLRGFMLNADLARLLVVRRAELARPEAAFAGIQGYYRFNGEWTAIVHERIPRRFVTERLELNHAALRAYCWCCFVYGLGLRATT